MNFANQKKHQKLGGGFYRDYNKPWNTDPYFPTINYLGGGFQILFVFSHPKIVEMIQFDEHIFFKWVGSTTAYVGSII